MNKNINILLYEADVNLGMVLADALTGHGFAVDNVTTSEDAQHALRKMRYALCILDAESVTTSREIVLGMREIGDETPAIILSRDESEMAEFEAFSAGADDYMVKPFSKTILLCRVDAILRRTFQDDLNDEQTVFKFGAFTMDTISQMLVYKNKSTHLSTKEVELLELLVRNLNQTVERSYILKKIWAQDTYFASRSLSVYVNHLRKLLAADSRLKVTSVHGLGYKLVLDKP